MTKEQKEKIEGMTDEQLMQLLDAMIGGYKYPFLPDEKFWVKRHMCRYAQEIKMEIESGYSYIYYGDIIGYFSGEDIHSIDFWPYFKKATEKFLEKIINNL